MTTAPVSDTRSGPRPASDRATLVGLALASLVILVVAQTGYTSSEMTHDAAHYLQLARSLARGEGFSTETHWALSLPRDHLPYPDTYRAPLFPVLVALVGGLFGGWFAAGKAVSIAAGVFLPPLVFHFTRHRLHRSRGTALLAASIVLVHHHLVLASTRPLTEATYTALTLGALLAATAPRPRGVVCGVLVGLACLLRYQGVVLVPAFLAILALDRPGGRAWLGRAVRFGLTVLVILSPWMVRNARVAGSPVYTDLKYHVVSTYDPDRSFYAYFHGTAPVDEPIPTMVDEAWWTARLAVHRLALVSQRFARENAGNPILLAFGVVGVVAILRRKPTAASADGDDAHARRSLAALGIFGAVNLGLVMLTFAKARHLTSLDPATAALAAVGADGVIGWARTVPRGRTLAALVIALVSVGVALEAVRSYRKLARHEPSEARWAEAAAIAHADRFDAREAVMAASPYYFAFALDRPAVSLPWSDDATLARLVDTFDVRALYVESPLAPGRVHPESFLATGHPPTWLVPDAPLLDGEVRVYRVDRPRLGEAIGAPGTD